MKPFLKWAGGKQRLAPVLEKLLPNNWQSLRYHEPFMGGAALFFYLRERGLERGVLSDANLDLVKTYLCLQDPGDSMPLPDLFRASWETHRDERTYYAFRDYFNQRFSHERPTARAARFVYLNKVGFNGLYRENAAGDFNVPCGSKGKKGPLGSCEEHLTALRRCAQALQGSEIRYSPANAVLDTLGEGDFAYLDPPYDQTYSGYVAGGFDRHAQNDLANAAGGAAARGAKIMISNADTPWVRGRYLGWSVHEVSAPRSVAAKGSSRKPAPELVITNY